MNGQIDIFDFLKQFPDITFGGCGPCICKKCLYYNSGRCPHGNCYDDKRNKDEPYDKIHPDKPPRTGWNSWKTDQGYWCRGGTFYPAYGCKHFVLYKGLEIEECITCNVTLYQDGYMNCPLLDSVGCEECYARLIRKMDDMESTEVMP